MASRPRVSLSGAFETISFFLILAALANAQGTNTDTNANTQQQQTTQRTATATQQQNTQQTQQTTASQVVVTSLPDLDATSTSTTALSTLDLSDAPALSSTNTNSQFIFTASLPTIAGVGVPTQVVPYTAGAAFMQKSSLPEGTVFIVVGAILGFLAACVIVWRGLVAWSLHRSVKKAQSSLYGGSAGEGSKMVSKKGTGGVYGMSTLGAGSTSSVDKFGKRFVSGHGGGGRLIKGSNGGSAAIAPTTAGRNSSLFFSPTAGAGSHTASHVPGNRTSSFLPAGFYNSPSATAPAAGAYSTNIQTGSASNLNPLNTNVASRGGYMPPPLRTFNSSPPDSPSLGPEGTSDPRHRYDAGTPVSYGSRTSLVGTHHNQHSVSNLNLHAPGGNVSGGRAPSTNLDDLFDPRRPASSSANAGPSPGAGGSTGQQRW